MGPTWGPPRSCRPQMGLMNLAIRENGRSDTRRRYLRHGYVTPSHIVLRDVVTYLYPRYLLLIWRVWINTIIIIRLRFRYIYPTNTVMIFIVVNPLIIGDDSLYQYWTDFEAFDNFLHLTLWRTWEYHNCRWWPWDCRPLFSWWRHQMETFSA